MRGDGSSGRGVSPAIQHETVIVDLGDEGQDRGQGGVQRGPRVIRGRIVRVRKRHRVALKEVPVAQVAPVEEPVEATVDRVPQHERAAVLLATAHRMQEMIDRGEVEGPAELARRHAVSTARVAQILGMALLAPGIQEEILCSGGTTSRHQGVLPMLCRAMPWERQRALWLLSRGESDRPA